MHFNRLNSGARALTFRNASSRTVLVRRGETRRSSYPFYMLAMRDTCLTVVKILLHQPVTRSAKTPVFNPHLIRLRKRVREMTLTRRTMQIYKIFMNPPNNYTNNYIHQTKIVGLQPQNIIKILKIFEIFEIVEIIIYLKNSTKKIYYICVRVGYSLTTPPGCSRLGTRPRGAFASPQSLATLLTSNPTMLFNGVQQLHTTSVSVSYAACWYG